MWEILGVIIAISTPAFFIFKWWAKRNRSSKVAVTVTNFIEDTNDWPVVALEKANEWPINAKLTGELEDGFDYKWANTKKIGVNGLELVQNADRKNQQIITFKYGSNVLVKIISKNH